MIDTRGLHYNELDEEANYEEMIFSWLTGMEKGPDAANYSSQL